ncbi:hypothetical protein O0I10_008434 [Lichtheimia ornata]|uniref:Uncharacterized protein n=1 Tax=Lichtheimia ornata TaxID=688661 RepID=A0AAD7UZN6_9FUNG|nr:uncharacterized protein O0I10_008434 [Lichtheimia ornata]KAJ8655994.1 hypothetical protein O0I10_008434 [Lichtheimia ornata]
MMMNSQPFEAPLTPPAEYPSSRTHNTATTTTTTATTPPTGAGGRKLSVTFDLPETPGGTKHSPLNEDDLLSPSISRSNSIDINAQAVPDTILVALLDRDEEMRHLVQHNTAFFSSLRSHLYHNWSRFENTLYCPRSKMSDQDWMGRISKALHAVPPLLQQFKDLVGYMGEDDTTTTTTLQQEEPSFIHVDLARIRDYPQRVARLRQAYPQFIINCQKGLSNPDAFFDTLFAPRSSTMPDDIWEMRIYDQLDHSGHDLLAQLKEIVEYEIECGMEDDHH